MEGYNPSLGCFLSSCKSYCRRWVPSPMYTNPPRRDALVDAYGRTDDPCARPARCGPCCEPVPKFRRPKELPECIRDLYKEEEREAKRQEACANHQKFVRCCCPKPPCPEMVIEPLDPNYPIAVEMPEDNSPENTWIMKELPCRTNIITGTFNPDDNKTPLEKLRDACDRTNCSCDAGLPLYPCRGAINAPRRIWTTLAEEMRPCDQPICEGSKFCDPCYMKEQAELKRKRKQEILEEKRRIAEEEQAKEDFFNPRNEDPCCGPPKLSEMEYCNCGCDMTTFLRQQHQIRKN